MSLFAWHADYWNLVADIQEGGTVLIRDRSGRLVKATKPDPCLECGHATVPGSEMMKRWEEVTKILDGGGTVLVTRYRSPAALLELVKAEAPAG